MFIEFWGRERKLVIRIQSLLLLQYYGCNQTCGLNYTSQNFLQLSIIMSLHGTVGVSDTCCFQAEPFKRMSMHLHHPLPLLLDADDNMALEPQDG